MVPRLTAMAPSHNFSPPPPQARRTMTGSSAYVEEDNSQNRQKINAGKVGTPAKKRCWAVVAFPIRAGGNRRRGACPRGVAFFSPLEVRCCAVRRRDRAPRGHGAMISRTSLSGHRRLRLLENTGLVSYRGNEVRDYRLERPCDSMPVRKVAGEVCEMRWMDNMGRFRFWVLGLGLRLDLRP